MPNLRPLCLLVVLFALPTILCAQEVRDTVRLKGAPEPIVGAISAETLRAVKIGAVTFGREQIEAIEYDPRAGAVDEVRRSGATAEACEKFLAEHGPDHPRKLFRQHALFRLAEARACAGDPRRACEALQRLFEEFPASQYYVEGRVLLAESQFAQGKKSAAQAAAAKAVADALGVGANAGEIARLKLCGARIDEECGDAKGALAAYRKISADAADAGASQRARLGEARCLAQLRETDAAANAFRRVAAEATDADLLAEAYDGLGDCALAQTGTESAHAALLDYLRGVVLYAPGAGAGSVAHARALVGAATCFERVRGALPTPEAQATYRERALTLCRECADRYPGTPQAREALRLAGAGR